MVSRLVPLDVLVVGSVAKRKLHQRLAGGWVGENVCVRLNGAGKWSLQGEELAKANCQRGLAAAVFAMQQQVAAVLQLQLELTGERTEVAELDANQPHVLPSMM